MTRLARHFAAMPGLGTTTASGSVNAARIVREGLPAKQLPACASCHAPGKPYPVLAGQSASYIAQRLRNWRGDETVVDACKSQATMPVIARRIPEDMIDPIAAYLAGNKLRPAVRGTQPGSIARRDEDRSVHEKVGCALAGREPRFTPPCRRNRRPRLIEQFRRAA